MSLLNIMDTVGSAMNAQSIRLNVVASNMANASVVAPTPEEAYKARHPVFSSLMKDINRPETVGVRVDGVVEFQGDHLRVYQPNSPSANEEGYVYKSNVDVVEEMVNMMSASRSYQTSVELFNTSRDLMLQTLRLGQG